MTVRIALVEPDLRLARGLAALLKEQGWSVSSYPTLGRFFDGITKLEPNAVLLNMQLQGMEGREILRALRANPGTSVTLLIGLSDNAHSKDEAVAAFTAGADEYFFKPLDTDLLVVRLRSLIARKPAPPEEEVFVHGEISVCPGSHSCTVSGAKVRLTKLEFGLLMQFIRNPQRVLTRGNLIDSLWRGDVNTGGRAVDRHISALRAKLGGDGRLLETVVGVGYRLVSGSSK
jgi:DNA-binding response OmpR family regulator